MDVRGDEMKVNPVYAAAMGAVGQPSRKRPRPAAAGGGRKRKYALREPKPCASLEVEFTDHINFLA